VSLRINSNIAAMTALNSLENNNGHLQTSIARLSSGLRINSAADDPAGLIISEEMKAQISGINQAVSNTQDAINMSKTAEAAMAQVQSLLTNMRGLAVNAANGAVADTATLQADQTQVLSSIQSINQIATSTQFGTKKLLDGSSGSQGNITDATDISSLYMSGTFAGVTVANGPVTITPVSSATDANIALNNTFSGPNAIVTQAGSFVINGYTFVSDGTETLQSLASKINTLASTTGVTATITNNAGAYSISLTQNDYGSKYSINYTDPNGVLNSTPTANSSGTDAVFNVSATTVNGVQTVPFTGGQSASQDGLTISDTYGNSITLTQTGNQLGSATAVGVVNAGNVVFQVGAYTNQSVSFSMPTLFAQNLGTGVAPNQSISTINLTTEAGAQQAISIIDAAITQLAETRGRLGAFQADYLQSTQSSLNVASANLTASQSQIADVDMASEITNYTKYQVLQQSGIAVLAQANQSPQQVLKLLQGA
jgi:flagellin